MNNAPNILPAPPPIELDSIAVRRVDAAAMLSISVGTLDKLIRRGEIPHKRVGRAVLFSVDALREWSRAEDVTNR